MGRRIIANDVTPVNMTRAQIFSGASEARLLTVNVWYRITILPVSSPGMIFNNESGFGSSLALNTSSGTGGVQIYSNGYGATGTAGLEGFITVNTWAMYTLTWAVDGTYKLYINGVQRATNTLAKATGDGGVSILGNLTTTNTSPTFFAADGDFAEFAAWDSVLSGAQVASLYVGAEAGLNADSVGTPSHYAKLLGVASPEPETIGGSSWTLNGSPPASTTIASSPAHPTMTTLSTSSASFAGINTGLIY